MCTYKPGKNFENLEKILKKRVATLYLEVDIFIINNPVVSYKFEANCCRKKMKRHIFFEVMNSKKNNLIKVVVSMLVSEKFYKNLY